MHEIGIKTETQFRNGSIDPDEHFFALSSNDGTVSIFKDDKEGEERFQLVKQLTLGISKT